MNRSKILKIELENIKSFKYGSLEFGDGITVISGNNGAGKSTVFEALGYCLFDVSPLSFIGKKEKFKRTGARNGSVTIWFQSVDGESYKILKRINGGRFLYKQLPDGEWDEEDSSINVAKLLGLDDYASPEAMFKDIIGPFQNDFVIPFLGSPAKKKEYFDKILGISQWKDLFSKTSRLDNIYQSKIDRIDNKLLMLEEKQEELETKKADYYANIGLLNESRTVFDNLSNVLMELENQINDMTEMEKRISGLTSDIEILNISLMNINKLSEENQVNLKNAGESLEIVNRTKAGYEKYSTALKAKKELEKSLKEKEKLDKQINDFQNRISALQAKIQERRTKNSEDQDKAEKNLENLENEYGGKKKELEKAVYLEEKEKLQLEDFRGIADFLENLRSSGDFFSRAGQNCKSALLEIHEIENQLVKDEMKLENISNIEMFARESVIIDSEIDEVKNEISRLQAQIEHYVKGQQDLEKGICPYMGEECKNLEGWDPVKFFDSGIKEKTKIIKSLTKKYDKLLVKKETAQNARDELISLKELKRQADTKKKRREDYIQRIFESIRPGDIEDLLSNIEGLNSRYIKHENMAIIEEEQIRPIRRNIPDNLENFTNFVKLIEVLIEKTTKTARENFNKRLEKRNKNLKNAAEVRSRVETRLESIESEIRQNRKNLKEIEKVFDSIKIDIKTLDENKEMMKNLNRQLKKYQDIGIELDRCNDEMSQNEENFRLYSANDMNSRNVMIFEKKMKELDEDLKKAKNEKIEAENCLEKLKDVFKSQELKTAREEKSRIIEKFGETKASIKKLEIDIDKYSKEIGLLETKLSALKELKKEKEEIEETRKFTSFLRNNIIKNIAEIAARGYREGISVLANRIYRRISGENVNEELKWEDNYEIALMDMVDGRIRTRTDQQLSGGQLMTAVIAIRLALLETIGSSIAFFDEPTSNLDEGHRRNLSEIFRDMDANPEQNWFNQLFLISHDDSFHGITQHNISIRLDDNNESVVSI